MEKSKLASTGEFVDFSDAGIQSHEGASPISDAGITHRRSSHLAGVGLAGLRICCIMLHNLLISAKQNHPNVALVKAFIARLLREFSSRDSARRVLETAFLTSLKVVKGSLEEYSSPDFRGDHNETEAIQRLNLHTVLTNGKHLLWLVERMIELRVVEMAVKEWSEQASFAADLQRAFQVWSSEMGFSLPQCQD